MNQYKYVHQAEISARSDKQGEENQVPNETELFINLNFNHKLTETDIKIFDNKSPLEQQIPN